MSNRRGVGLFGLLGLFGLFGFRRVSTKPRRSQHNDLDARTMEGVEERERGRMLRIKACGVDSFS